MAKGKDLTKTDHKDSTVGPTLGRARERAGITQPEAAKAVGVHPMTISEWERGKARVPAKALMVLLPMYGISLEDLQANGKPERPSQRVKGPAPGHVSEPRSSYASGITFSTAESGQEGRVWLQRFVLELTEAGADDDFVAWARRFLTSPENFVIYYGGQPEEMTDEQKLRHMKGLAEGVRAILADRQSKREPRAVRQGGGTPVPRTRG